MLRSDKLVCTLVSLQGLEDQIHHHLINLIVLKSEDKPMFRLRSDMLV